MNLVKVKSNFFKECQNKGADSNKQLLHNEAGKFTPDIDAIINVLEQENKDVTN